MNIQTIENDLNFRSCPESFVIDSLRYLGMSNLAAYIEKLIDERDTALDEAQTAKHELEITEDRLSHEQDSCDKLTDDKEKLINALNDAAKRLSKYEKL